MIRIVHLGPGEEAVLDAVAPDVFDNAIVAEHVSEFLSDPRHQIVVAMADGVVVGMATGVRYVHPDKPPELWINEVGVAATHRKLGLAKRMLTALLDEARSHGCVAAWVLTERSNTPARRLYAAAGGVEDPTETVMFDFPLAEPSGS